MSSKYHLKDNGDPGICSAQHGNCPKGKDTPHFSTPNEARAHVEKLYEDLAKDPDYQLHLNARREGRKKNTNILAAREKYRPAKVSKYSISLDEGVEKALESIRKVGNPLIVGGAVRDSFSESENKDIDIEVYDSKIDEIISNFKKDGFFVDEVGKKFGVLKISKKGVVSDLDVSVPRRENRVGAGHRGFEVSMDRMNVSEAAERRDFTFNAMSYDPKLKVLVDPSEGKKDLDNKVMRHVSEQFAEDPLRVLRGFQFAGRFEMTYAPETAKLAKSIRSEYSDLSVERVREEWNKFYTKSTKPSAGIKALRDSGWDDITPGLSDALSKSEKNIDKLIEVPKDRRRAIGSALIMSHMKESRESNSDRELFLQETVDLKKDRSASRNILKADSKELNNSSFARKKFTADNPEFSFQDYEYYGKLTEDKNILKVCENAKKDGIFDKPEPPLVGGKEIFANTNRKPGPWMKNLLSDVRDKQYASPELSKSDLVNYMKDQIDKY